MVARHATEAAAQRAAERDWERAREVEQATAVEAARTDRPRTRERASVAIRNVATRTVRCAKHIRSRVCPAAAAKGFALWSAIPWMGTRLSLHWQASLCCASHLRYCAIYSVQKQWVASQDLDATSLL